MTERELYLKKTDEIIKRLRERGVAVPTMPKGDGQEMALCPLCQGTGGITESKRLIVMRSSGRGIANEETKIHCQNCGGGGYVVSNALREWGESLLGLLHGGS